MPVIEPIYSIEKGCEVFHNHTDCTERNNIEARNIRAGLGGKRLCKHCQDLGSKDNAFKMKSITSLNGFGIWGLADSIKKLK